MTGVQTCALPIYQKFQIAKSFNFTDIYQKELSEVLPAVFWFPNWVWRDHDLNFFCLARLPLPLLALRLPVELVRSLQRPCSFGRTSSLIYHRRLAFDLALHSACERALRFGSASQDTKSSYLSWGTRFVDFFLVFPRYFVKAGFTITEKAGIV